MQLQVPLRSLLGGLQQPEQDADAQAVGAAVRQGRLLASPSPQLRPWRLQRLLRRRDARPHHTAHVAPL